MRKKMKKNFCFLFLFFFSSLLFAEFDACDFDDGKITKFVQFDMASSTTRGIEKEQTLVSFEAGAFSHWFDSIAGFQISEDAFDFTLAGEGWLPCANWYFGERRLVLGVGGLYHFERYKDISWEHDFIIDSAFRLSSLSGFCLTFRGGYSFKVTQIDALQGYVPNLFDHYPEVTIQIQKKFSNGFEIFYEHSSHDMYRYPIFCSPVYKLGAAINLDSGLRLGGEGTIRFVDQYTTAPYCDSLILRMSARFSF